MSVQHSTVFLECAATFCRPPLGPRMVYDYAKQKMVRDKARDAFNLNSAGYAYGFCIWALAHEVNGVPVQV